MIVILVTLKAQYNANTFLNSKQANVSYFNCVILITEKHYIHLETYSNYIRES